MRPADDPATAAPLIVRFLTSVGVARVERIVTFMQSEPLSFPPGTTRNMLVSLSRAGKIRRVGYGAYRIAQGE